MAVTLGSRVWMDAMLRVQDPTPETLARAVKEFTFKNPKLEQTEKYAFDTSGIPKTIELFTYDEDTSILSVPRACGWAEDYEDETSYVEQDPLPLKFKARKGQGEAVAAVVHAMANKPERGAILVAPTGSGKTVMGVAAANQMGTSTLILIHKEDLADQWESAINMLTEGKALVGRARAGRWDCGRKHHFVIGMIQSVLSGLKRGTIPDDWASSFGLVLSDEVHVTAAEQWQRVISLFPSRYRMGVTATPKRGDKMEKVFYLHIGPLGHEMIQGSLKADAYFHGCPCPIWRNKIINHWNHEFNPSKGLSQLSKNHKRSVYIKTVLDELVARDDRRKIMVLSDRVDLLTWLARNSPAPMCRYWGKYTPSAVEVAAARIILGTYGKAGTGTDLPEVDTVVLVTPRGRVGQAIGRALRKLEGKSRPEIHDIVDVVIPEFVGYARAREGLYRRKGHRVMRGVQEVTDDNQ